MSLGRAKDLAARSKEDLFASLGIGASRPAAPPRPTSAQGSLFPSDKPVELPATPTQSKYMWPPVAVPSSSTVPQIQAEAAAGSDPLSSFAAASTAAAPRAAACAPGPAGPAAAFPPSTIDANAAATGFGSNDVAPPSWHLPKRAPLRPGEVLRDQPAPAQRMNVQHSAPAGSQHGTLFLTSLRLLWEADADAPTDPIEGGALEGGGGGAAASVVEVPLNSIEKLRKLKLGTGAALGAVIEVHQKYNARPSLRLMLGEAEYARLHGVLRTQIGVPTQPSDVRADLSRCFAMAHGKALRAEGGGGAVAAGWAMYDPEREFHRQGLNNPLSHWRISKINEQYARVARVVCPRGAARAFCVRVEQLPGPRTSARAHFGPPKAHPRPRLLCFRVPLPVRASRRVAHGATHGVRIGVGRPPPVSVAAGCCAGTSCAPHTRAFSSSRKPSTTKT